MRKLFVLIVTALATGLYLQAGIVDSLLIDAVQKYDDGDVQSASLELFNLSKRYPDNDAVFYYMGLCDIEQGDNIAADKHISRAWQLDSTNLWYGNALAGICIARKEYDRAYPVLKRIVTRDPATFASPNSLCILGEIEADRGNFPAAVANFDQAIAMDPSYYPARLYKAEALRTSGDEKAYLDEVETLMYDEDVSDQLKAEYLSMSLQDADDNFRKKWQEKIIGIVEKCENLYPDRFVFHFLRLQLAEATETDLIIRECEASLSCSDLDTTRALFCLSLMGDCLYTSGNSREAYRAYEKALKINGRYLPVLNNYAYFLSEEGRKLKKALKMSGITVVDEPDNPIYLDTYGWILHLLGQDEDAEKYLKRAVVNGGRSSRVILEHFADVLDALGKTSVADFYRDLAKQQQ